MTIKWDDTNFQKEIKIRSRDMLQAVGRYMRNTVKIIITQKDIIDTGDLKKSIAFRTESENLILRVGTDKEYAPFIELGHRTRSGSHVAPRSFLRAALDQLDQQTVDRIIARQKRK